jgi:hypothetical protein
MKFNITAGLTILIGIFTVLTIWLLLIDLWLTEDENKIILLTAITFIGTILGGVLSGAITLIGVNKTISENRRKDEIDSLGDKLKSLSYISAKMNDILKKFPNESETSFNINLNFLGIVHEDISNIYNSLDVIILGKEVYSSLNDVGQQIVKLRTDVMMMRVTDHDDIYSNLREIISGFLEIFEDEKKNIVDRYYNL